MLKENFIKKDSVVDCIVPISITIILSAIVCYWFSVLGVIGPILIIGVTLFILYSPLKAFITGEHYVNFKIALNDANLSKDEFFQKMQNSEKIGDYYVSDEYLFCRYNRKYYIIKLEDIVLMWPHRLTVRYVLNFCLTINKFNFYSIVYTKNDFFAHQLPCKTLKQVWKIMNTMLKKAPYINIYNYDNTELFEKRDGFIATQSQKWNKDQNELINKWENNKKDFFTQRYRE